MPSLTARLPSLQRASQPLAVRKLQAPQSTKTEHPSGLLSISSSTLQRPKHAETAQQSVVLAGQNRNGYESHQALCHSSEGTERPISAHHTPSRPHSFLPLTLRPVLLFSPLFSSPSPHSHSLHTLHPYEAFRFIPSTPILLLRSSYSAVYDTHNTRLASLRLLRFAIPSTVHHSDLVFIDS